MSVVTSDTEHIATTANSADEFTHVDPGTLMIGANVRTDTRADAKDFAASIRSRGVLERSPSSATTSSGWSCCAGSRRVLVNNKAWRSSTTVRRDWLRQFASRKAATSGAKPFIAAAVIGCQSSLGQAFTSRHSLLRQWRPAAAEESHPGWDSSACQRLLDAAKTPKASTMPALGGGPRRVGGRRHRVDVA